LSEERLVAYRCSSCGTAMFPRHTRCRSCKTGRYFDELPLSEGVVVTHTRLTATRPGFPKELRFVVVEFACGVRVLGQVTADREPRTGEGVRASWGQLSERDGKVSNGFRFVLA